MKNLKRFLVCFLAVLAVLLTFTACHDPNDDVLEHVGVVTADSISELDLYSNLQSADLRGSDCYDAIVQYIAAHPEVNVQYDVAIGTDRYDSAIETLSITGDKLDFTALLSNLKYLDSVASLVLPETELTVEQIASLTDAYPGIAVEYTVSLAGNIYSTDAAEVDLSSLTSGDLDAAIAKIRLLPAVTSAQLNQADGTSSLSTTDVKKLQQELPDVFFHYSFDLFGKTVSTTDEVIEYFDQDIGNEGESQIREALDILTSCTYIKFDDCGIDSEVMAGIRDDYPDVKVVWRIYADYFSMCTDETMIRMTFDLQDGDVSELKYCTDVTYMDIGHNDWLTDISFVEYMPKLECVIVSGSRVSDISYFEDHDSLVWLELCFCGQVKDLSVLATCDNLKYLNVSYSQVSDLSPLDNLKLDRLNCMNAYVTLVEQRRYKELHPDCISVFEGKQPYGYGWRYNDHGYTFFDYYKNMRVVFRYDEENYWGNTKER